MGKLVSLKEVNATVLPANVLVLLSKYAQAVRQHTGLVIKVSSLNVFTHVHNTSKLTQNLIVRGLHRDLLLTVNAHLREGTMQTNSERESSRRSSLRTSSQFNSNNSTHSKSDFDTASLYSVNL